MIIYLFNFDQAGRPTWDPFFSIAAPKTTRLLRPPQLLFTLRIRFRRFPQKVPEIFFHNCVRQAGCQESLWTGQPVKNLDEPKNLKLRIFNIKEEHTWKK